MRILAALLFLATPAAAQSWDMIVAGVSIGTATLDVRDAGGAYRIDGTARSAGVARAVGGYDYAGRITGSGSTAAPRPDRYEEVERVRGDERRTVLNLSGTPSVEDAPGDALPPETIRGALDPLSAMNLILRDRPAAGACDLSLRFTDGVRMAAIALRPTSDPLTCAGAWQRLAGPPPADGRERRRAAAFTVSLTPIADGVLRVAEISADAPIGRFRLVRR